MRRRVITWMSVLLLGWFSTAGWAAVQQPDQLVRQTSEQMLAVLKAQRAELEADPGKLYGAVSEIVLPHFDFEKMARWVLGKYWRQADAAQREAFTRAFRELLVRTYGTALLSYDDQEVAYLPLHMAAGDKQVTVRTEVDQHGAPSIPINYSLYLGEGGWKVFDVVVNGVSLVSNYRTSFSNEIRANGMQALIDRLIERNREANQPRTN